MLVTPSADGRGLPVSIVLQGGVGVDALVAGTNGIPVTVVPSGGMPVQVLSGSLGSDTTPSAFSFVDQTGVAVSSVTTSNAITVSGINAASTISVTGGQYQINGGAWVSTSGTVVNGDSVNVRQTSSASYSTQTDTVLTIGGVSDTFSVTTRAPIAVLNPPSGWDGTRTWGSRPSLPVASLTPYGIYSQDEQVTGNLLVTPGQWIHQKDKFVTAVFFGPQMTDMDLLNYSAEAVFWLEGNTVSVTEWSKIMVNTLQLDGSYAMMPQIGFTVELGAGLGSVTAGDATIAVTMRAQHGLERVMSRNIVLNVDGKLDPIRIDFVSDFTSQTIGSKALAAPFSGATGTYTAYASNRSSYQIGLVNGSTAVTGANSITANSTMWLNRPVIYVNKSLGNDTNAGNRPGTGAKQTAKGPLIGAGQAHQWQSGEYRIIEFVGDGIYNIDGIGGSVLSTSTRFMEVVGEDGVSFTQTTRSTNDWRVQSPGGATFRNITFDLSKFTSLSGAGSNNCIEFDNCKLIDPNGSSGPIDANGWPISYKVSGGGANDAANVFFFTTPNQQVYLRECAVINYQLTGANGYRNVAWEATADGFTTAGGTGNNYYDNWWAVNCQLYMPRMMYTRTHFDQDLTVASAVYNGGTARTTITINVPPSGFGIETMTSGANAQDAYFLVC